MTSYYHKINILPLGLIRTTKGEVNKTKKELVLFHSEFAQVLTQFLLPILF